MTSQTEFRIAEFGIPRNLEFRGIPMTKTQFWNSANQELEELARTDAIVEEMVALGEPSLTLGGPAKDGVRDQLRDLPLRLL